MNNTGRKSRAFIVCTYPDVRRHLQDNSGQIRPFINIFVGEDDIRSLNSQQTIVDDSSLISIIPAIAGGNALKPEV